jgi:hypothetical protein
MKIAFIGTSHIASLKRAVAQTEFPPHVDITFFGSSVKHFSKNTNTFLEPDGRYLVSPVDDIRQTYRLTAGVDRIDTQEFDAFVLVGLTFSYRAFLSLFLNHVRYRHASYMPSAQIISDEALEECIKAQIEEDVGLKLRRLLDATERPVFSIPSPCPSEEILERKEFKRVKLAAGGPYLRILYDEFCSRNERLMEENNLLLVPANPSIQRYPGFNRAEYSIDSGLIGWTEGSLGPKKRGDEWHMNALYGKIVLQDFISFLGACRAAGYVIGGRPFEEGNHHGGQDR